MSTDGTRQASHVTWGLSVLALLGVCALTAARAGAQAAAWDVPAEGSCVAPRPSAEDAPALPFKPGDHLDAGGASILRDYVPEQVWEYRERFFFEGMGLEIGPCYRDYSSPDFFRQATERFRGQPTLGPGGELRDYRVGLPFPPDSIRPEDPDLALKWAWNWVNRYAGGGHYGDVRLLIVGHKATVAELEGSNFFAKLTGRSELADHDYRVDSPVDGQWVAGGSLQNQKTGNRCSFRQYATGERRPDLFFWSPGARKIVRGQSPDAEGPLSGCMIDVSVGGGLFVHGGSPQLHRWRLVGVRDLLAPINAIGAAARSATADFGPWGISFANERWELRRAIVLEGRLKEGSFEDHVERFVWYLDLQTLTPLYYEAYRAGDIPAGIGHFVGQWSEDRPGYPRWPDSPERPRRVIDSVGSAFADWNDQHAVRIETWDSVSVPPDDEEVLRLISKSSLRGR